MYLIHTFIKAIFNNYKDLQLNGERFFLFILRLYFQFEGYRFLFPGKGNDPNPAGLVGTNSEPHGIVIL